MNEMVNRMARAMCRVDGFDPDEKSMRDRYMSTAHAAITSIREPTLKMMRAACEAVNKEQLRPIRFHLTDADIVWRAMVAAAETE